MVEIDVAGLNLEYRKEAVVELDQTFAECPDMKIVVTKDFDSVVTEYFGRRGVFVPYESKRFGGEVVACKTMNYPLDSELRTCLVVNANAPMFSDWENPNAKMIRFFCVAHEKKHVLLYNSRYLAVGHQAFFSGPKSVSEWMEGLADDVVSEHLAESYAIGSLSKKNGSDFGMPQDATANYLSDRQEGFETTLSVYFATLESFVWESVERYSHGNGSMNELWGLVYLRVRDVLNVLALMAAYVHSTPPISKSDSIESILASTSSFKDTWQEMERHFKLINDDREDHKKVLFGLASCFQELFLRLGIKLSDGPRGMVLNLV